eukprot:6213386-Pleurochrysis_carterae.AAC.2
MASNPNGSQMAAHIIEAEHARMGQGMEAVNDDRFDQASKKLQHKDKSERPRSPTVRELVCAAADSEGKVFAEDVKDRLWWKDFSSFLRRQISDGCRQRTRVRLRIATKDATVTVIATVATRVATAWLTAATRRRPVGRASLVHAHLRAHHHSTRPSIVGRASNVQAHLRAHRHDYGRQWRKGSRIHVTRERAGKNGRHALFACRGAHVLL